MHLRILIPTLAALAIAAVLVGCQRSGAQQGPQAPPPPVVTVAPPLQKVITEYDELTGRTVPVEFVEVRPRVSGQIEEVKFESGELVTNGTVLFQIDPRYFQAEFNQRAAEYESAKVRLANAEREAKRTTALLENRAISTEEGEQRQSRFEEARAMLLAAEAGRDRSKLDLEYATVRAPVSGRVSRALVTKGNYVSGMAGNATLLTTIVSVDPIYVYADMDENSLLRFQELTRQGGLTNGVGRVPVDLQLGSEPGFPHHGHIESFDNRLDPQSGSILVRAVFPNRDGRILPGLFARLRLPASAEKSALFVDESAIGTDQAQKFVLTLSASNTAAYRPVELGPLIDGKRLVRQGLQPEDKVLQHLVAARVRPGMPVQPRSPASEGREPSGAANASATEAGAAKPAL